MPFRPWQPTSSTPSTSRRLRQAIFDEKDKENGRPTASPSPPVLSKKRKSRKSPTALSRRNERERNRVHLINLGFERLRAVVPKREGEQLSKISTLKKAIWYIEHLDRVLQEGSDMETESEVVNAVEHQTDSGVVGTGLGDVEQSIEGEAAGQRLSPIFPPPLEESLGLDSGIGSFYTPQLRDPEPLESPRKPRVRLWRMDFDETSTPNR